jgi:cell division protein FtsN
MQKGEKFFIFSWKELLVIGLLVITGLGFFFTLGLHYGKNLKTIAVASGSPEVKMEESPEILPSSQTLDQGTQHAESAAQEAIKAATDQAMKESDLKVQNPKPLDLPGSHAKTEEPAKAEAHSKTEEHAKASDHAKGDDHAKVEPVATHEAVKEEVEEPAKVEPKVESRFAIQLGSYPGKDLAQKKVALFSKRGLKTEVRMAIVNGENRYRVVLPGFKTKKAADAKGHELHQKRKVESWVVIKTE